MFHRILFADVQRFSARCLYALGLAAIVFGLSACSPEYDWRDIRNEEGGYLITFPAKPTTAARQVKLGGQNRPMTMQAAKVKHTMFAVGVVTLPDSQSEQGQALRTQILQEMQQGLMANLQGGALVTQSTQAISGQTAGNPPQVWQGVLLKETGQAKGEANARRMTAYILARGNRLYQVMVLEVIPKDSKIGKESAIAEQTDQFFASFKPY